MRMSDNATITNCCRNTRQARAPRCCRSAHGLEQEIVELSEEDKALFLQELGLEKSGLDRLIQLCYSLLGLISYLTAGEPEVRAWTITQRHQGSPGGRQNPFGF